MLDLLVGAQAGARRPQADELTEWRGWTKDWS
jgi:hypothetical protein